MAFFDPSKVSSRRSLVIFGLSDAITDLIANSVGALLAALVALALHGRETRNA